MEIWDELDEFLNLYDGDFHAEVGSLALWSGQLRVTVSDPDGEPARSVAFHSVAGRTPEEVAQRVLADCRAWMAEGNMPLPVPRWKPWADQPLPHPAR